MPNATDAVTKRALLIGIDTYLDPIVPTLHGCVNDVELMENEVLRNRYGFTEITKLTNAQATQAEITAAFEQLIEETQPNDVVVVHYSGHGSTCDSDDPASPTGLDSTIVPADSGRDALPNRDITDKTIHGWLERLGQKTSYTTLFFDSCHSGTITRDVTTAQSRSVPRDTRNRARSLPPAAAGARATRGIGALARGAPAAEDGEPKYVVISGCRDEERSFEYDTVGETAVRHGALTWYLSQELLAPGKRSYRDIFERIAPRVTAVQGQHPQLEGRVHAEVLGIGVLPPVPYVTVTRHADRPELAAGAAHRVTVGSEYAVYEPGVTPGEGVTPIGHVRVTAIDVATATIEALESTDPSLLVENARAVETKHAHTASRVRVRLDDSVRQAPEAAAFVAALGAAPRIEVVDAGDAAAVIALVPRFGAIDQPTLVARDAQGTVLTIPKPLPQHAEMVANLTLFASYLDMIGLRNASPSSRLQGKYRLEIVRRIGDPAQAAVRWEVVERAEGATYPLLYVGDRVGFRVVGEQDAPPAWVNLLDLEINWRIGPIYPLKGQQVEQVGPGKTFPIDDGGKGFPLSAPKGYPFAPHETGDGPIDVDERLKLFLTSRFARFDGAEQPASRSLGAPPSRASVESVWRSRAVDTEEATAAIAAGPAQAMDDADDWTVVDTGFTLRLTPRPAEPPPDALDAKPAPTLAAPSAVAPSPVTAASPATSAIGDALAKLGVTVTPVVATERVASRSLGDPPVTRVTVPKPPPDHGQVLVSTDENGLVTWHISPNAPAAGARDLDGTQTYDIADAPAGPATGRGWATSALQKKLLEVLVFPLLEPGAELLSEHFAPRWETSRRPYRLRTFGPGDYDVPNGTEVTGADLAAGRALLLLHGTLGRAHTDFASLLPDDVVALNARYADRVFAFEHHTLSDTPKENARRLARLVPENGTLDVDIIGDSRGGLVARWLAERGHELAPGRTIRVGKVIFVGTPNAGSTVFDPKHISRFLDATTTLLACAPPNGVTEVLEGALMVAKVLAVGGAKGLPGLMAMRPGDELLAALNVKGDGDAPPAGPTYYALASSYAPVPGKSLAALALARVMGKFFDSTANDLLVPAASVYDAAAFPRFPITEKLVLDGQESISHLEYFASPDVRKQIHRWLAI